MLTVRIGGIERFAARLRTEAQRVEAAATTAVQESSAETRRRMVAVLVDAGLDPASAERRVFAERGPDPERPSVQLTPGDRPIPIDLLGVRFTGTGARVDLGALGSWDIAAAFEHPNQPGEAWKRMPRGRGTLPRRPPAAWSSHLPWWSARGPPLVGRFPIKRVLGPTAAELIEPHLAELERAAREDLRRRFRDLLR